MTAPMKAADLPTMSVEALVPYARNSRTHSPAQVAQIAASIKEFGFTNPVLIDDDSGIIAGHGRVLAARKLKMADVPVLVLSGLTPAQRRAYVIADNKLALNAGWDDEALKAELEALMEDDFDVTLLGFDEAELDALLADEPEPTEAAVPKGNLADRFLIPPFSVLNAREGWWQDRKRAWLALGIKSELGRGETAGGADNERHDSAPQTEGGSSGVKGLTWGNHPAITEPGLNHYRNKAKAK